MIVSSRHNAASANLCATDSKHMRYLRWANRIVAGILVAIWAIACSGGPEEPTRAPYEVARDEACGFVAQILDGDTTARQEFSEWKDAYFGIDWFDFEELYFETHYDSWPSLVNIWVHAHKYISRGSAVGWRTYDDWGSIEKGTLDYLNALCVTDELKEEGQNLEGCSHWRDNTSPDVPTEKEMRELRTAVDDGRMRGALASITSVRLSARSVLDSLEQTRTSARTVEEFESAASVSWRATVIGAWLCDEA